MRQRHDAGRILNLRSPGTDESDTARASLVPDVRIDMDRLTLTWTAFVDDQAGRATLVRNEVDRHWEGAEPVADLGDEFVSVWADRDGVPVVAEARLGHPSPGDLGAAATLERLLSEVLGPLSLGSPTLWGLVPGWVWFGVATVWPPLTADEQELEHQRSFESALDRAKRNSRRTRARAR